MKKKDEAVRKKGKKSGKIKSKKRVAGPKKRKVGHVVLIRPSFIPSGQTQRKDLNQLVFSSFFACFFSMLVCLCFFSSESLGVATWLCNGQAGV